MNGAALDDGGRWASIADLRAALAARAVSAEELAVAAIRRLEHDGRALNAVAAITPRRALTDARRSDRRIRGAAARQLDGIPYGAKDLIDVRGVPTRFGSRASDDAPAAADADSIARAGRAGATIVAKLAMMELAGLATCRADAAADGPGRNPWNPDRWSGGSSSGSAAAVGAGLVPFALASETAGSMVSPAAYCGVSSIRPTYDLVSRRGTRTLDKIGVMARSAEDCAEVLRIVARRPGAVARGGDLRSIRVGWAEVDVEETAEPALRPALRDGLRALRDVSGPWSAVALPADVPYLGTAVTIINGEASSALAEFDTRDRRARLVDPEQAAALHEMRRSLLAVDYLDALRVRERVRQAAIRIFTEVDVIVSYGMPHVSPLLAGPIPGQTSTAGNAALGLAGNLAGLPAVSIPCGLTDEGLPVGLQLVGPAVSDGRLLGLAAAFQATTAWHHARPGMHRSLAAAGASSR